MNELSLFQNAKSPLPELKQIQKLHEYKDPLIRNEVLCEVKSKRGETYPVIATVIGSKDRTAPTLGIFGGVHGLERVGTHLNVAYLDYVFNQLQWNKDYRRALEDSRIISIPLINPGGMSINSRCNPNDVDLMRNAPVECVERPSFLVSGQRISNLLPWYRGDEGAEMQPEAKALIDFVIREGFEASTLITLDLHSGFGLRDRFWYPYAKTREDFPRLAEVMKLKELFEQTHPHHVYIIEAQSVNYVTHGDLWDYLFDLYEEDDRYGQREGQLYLPFTLEMGSWKWIKKNPLQAFNRTGYFNPHTQHRFSRIMRRHHSLISFLHKAIKNREAWKL